MDDKQPTLVPGRAGEIVDYTDAETFKFVERIFSADGPYRKVLHEFGIGNPKSKDTFLVYKDGRVYSDIVKENKVLWRSCMSKLGYKDGKVELKPDYSPASVIKGLFGFLKKTTKEAAIISNHKRYLSEASEMYKEYSEFVKEAVRAQTVPVDKYLEEYEKTIHITYLYELFFNYNFEKKGDADLNSCIKGYVTQNDYLLRYDPEFAEIKFASKEGFSLKKSPEFEKLINTPIEELIFIPSEIPDCECNFPALLLVEKKLQCLKNNLRLKAAFLLNFIKL